MCDDVPMQPGDQCRIASSRGGTVVGVDIVGYDEMARREEGGLSSGLVIGLPTLTVGLSSWFAGRRLSS